MGRGRYFEGININTRVKKRENTRKGKERQFVSRPKILANKTAKSSAVPLFLLFGLGHPGPTFTAIQRLIQEATEVIHITGIVLSPSVSRKRIHFFIR